MKGSCIPTSPFSQGCGRRSFPPRSLCESVEGNGLSYCKGSPGECGDELNQLVLLCGLFVHPDDLKFLSSRPRALSGSGPQHMKQCGDPDLRVYGECLISHSHFLPISFEPRLEASTNPRPHHCVVLLEVPCRSSRSRPSGEEGADLTIFSGDFFELAADDAREKGP